MLKKRIVGSIVTKSGLAVQSFNFKRYLPIGKPEIAADFLNKWGIDEISLCSIDTGKKSEIDFEMIKRVSNHSFVPLAYGGGIDSIEKMTKVVKAGADKIMLNSALLKNISLVTEGAKHFGSQCVVASIDFIRRDENYFVFDNMNRRSTAVDPLQLALKSIEAGAGEIFLNSVDRDGSKSGFDLNLAKKIINAVNVPVVICGGAGEIKHFHEALCVKNISGVAAANYFQHFEHSATLLKAGLTNNFSHTLRSDTYFNYLDSSVAKGGRLLKKPDELLKELLFERHEKEVI